MGRPIGPLTQDDIRRLTSYAWPGNVRELHNVIERAVITAIDGKLNLDRALPDAPSLTTRPALPREVPPGAIHTAKEFEAMERDNM